MGSTPYFTHAFVLATIGLFAALVNVPSSNTPVSYIILQDRRRGALHSKDLEKQAANAGTPAQYLAKKGDGFLSAARGLWTVEGWRGFSKGYLPRVSAMLVSAVCEVCVDRILHAIISTKRTGFWRLGNAALTAVLKSLAIALVMNPLTILETRLRLSSPERTCNQEARYLFLRMSLAEWFGKETVLPHMVRKMTRRAISALTTSLAPLILRSSIHPANANIIAHSVSSFLDGTIFSFVAFPFLRCQELAAVTVKPLEDPMIDFAEYNGLASEIVLDSAWDGLRASVERDFLVNAATALGAVPLVLTSARPRR